MRTRPPSEHLRSRTVVALLVLGASVAGVGLWRLVESYDSDAGPTKASDATAAIASGVAPANDVTIADSIVDASRASEPFTELTETRLEVGGKSLRVVVADEVDERSEGLRRRRTIGPYDAMLFVYEEPVQVAFTMSTVPVRLDIAFYDARGRVVTRLRMEPCTGSELECPLYPPEHEFRYALETLAGDLPRGRLSPG